MYIKKYLWLILSAILFFSACSFGSKNSAAINIASENQVAALNGIQKGQMPPDFTIKTAEGKEYTLSNFKNENKPILLYFFATWCPYCSEDFGIVKNIYPKYSGEVTFLAIDLDMNENAELIKNYKNKKMLKGVDFAAADEKILSDYGIIYTTTKFAIGRNGTILYKGSGVFDENQWTILLDGLIKS